VQGPKGEGVKGPKRPKGERALLLLALAGCAGVVGPPRGRLEDAPGLRGWQAAVAGRPVEAVHAFDERLVAAPDDLLARFGRATLAFDHGEVATALDDYAGVVATAARLLEKDRAASSPDAAWAALVAPVAAARARSLHAEVGPLRRAHAEAILLAPETAASLPWQGRFELAHLSELAARRRGDAEGLERDARARGCAAEVYDADALGPMPHLDLDTAKELPAPATWAPLLATGCRLSLSARTGRPGAERLRAAIEVPRGTYDLILDYDGEARVAVDGGPAVHHGSELTAGPRVGAWTLSLPAGRHELEIRLATQAGRAELALMVSPRAPGGAARFVDPRTGGQATRAGVLAAVEPAAGPGSSPTDGAAAALRDYCLGYLAEARGAVEDSLALGARLAARRGFSTGLALAATIARGDPTRPSSFTRDAGRAALRAALTADEGNARAWQDLAAVELEDDHLREAIAAARSAARTAPRWWMPEQVLSHALRARGLEWDADRALDRAAEVGGAVTSIADAPCLLLDALRRRADERRALDQRARLEKAVAACDAESQARIDPLRARGELGAAEQALRAALRLAPDRDDLSADLVDVLLAAGKGDAALAELSRLVDREPTDPMLRLRVADAQVAAGKRDAALETVRRALALRPDAVEVRRAARALGLPLPLDAHRLDGVQVIRAFEASGRRYAAPAVVVLDRTVSYVTPEGAQLTLTHELVRVQSKDAIDRWAEVEVPPGAEVLTLRTHKPDGTTREPEEIAGKETVSAANVAIGDYVEWETLETRPASMAFSPGFLGERFYFQSFDAPLDRTELVLVTPASMKVELDRRAGAPAPRETVGADGLRVQTFAATNVPQLFAERAAVPAIEYVPSVRPSCGVSFAAWTRYVREQLYGTTRSSPALRARAEMLAKASGAQKGDRARLAAAVVKWVTENVDAVDDLRDPATLTLARGRGNRLALMLALLRELDVPARSVLARSRLVAETDAAAPVQELDDFGDSIVEIDLAPDRHVWVDPRLRYASFGYLPPSLDGARTLALGDGHFGVARSTGTADHRSVDVTIRLDEQGGGVAVATEELTGWPALEWAELIERFGADRARLRQDFEQRWLGVQFPGARLRELDVDVARTARPGEAPRAGVARVRYSFVSPQLAVRSDHEMRLLPTFFRSQPGRRFATEPRRSTTLVLGFDVPFHLTATLELPRAADLVEPEEEAGAARRVERKGAYSFVEERRLRRGGPGGEVLVLTRDATLPLSRVAPGEYAGVAADLRRVDGLEQREIRIRLRGARGVK
jgi:tetratricopeptide (TPR) repeat protein